MPAPIPLWIGGAKFAGMVAAGSAIGTAVSSMTQAWIGPQLMPIERNDRYRANEKTPNLVPDLLDIFRLYYTRRITEADARLLAGFQGVSFGISDRVLWNAWHRLFDLAEPTFDPSDFKRWWRKGLLPDPEKVFDALDRRGLFDRRYQHIWAHEYDATPLEVVAMLWRWGLIDDDEVLERFLLAHNYSPAQLRSFKEAWRAAPGPLESLELWRRRAIDDRTVDQYLRYHGLTDEKDRARYKELAKVIPSPTDLYQLVVKDAWRDDVAFRYGYDLERSPEYDYWLTKQGLGWSENVPLPDGTEIVGKPWYQLLWRAHWRNLSPELAFAMYHRLRKDRIAFYQAEIPGVQPFTLENLNDVLRINDYPPAFRAQMAAIALAPMRLVDIRNAWRDRIITRDQAVAEFRDRGQSLAHAEMQTELVDAAERRRQFIHQESRHRKLQQQAGAAVIEMSGLGVLDKELATTALQNLGYSEQTANLALSVATIKENAKTYKAVLRRARLDYMAGRITKIEVMQRLEQAGFGVDAANQWAERFEIERGEGRVALSVAKNIDLYKRFLIDYQTAFVRLRNLGVRDPDAMLLLAAAEQDMVRMRIKEMEAAARRQKQQAAEMAALVRQAQATKEKFQAALRRITPLSTLKQWLLAGELSKTGLVDRLLDMGYPDDVIRLTYKQWTGLELEEPGYEQGVAQLAESAPPMDGQLEGPAPPGAAP